jgi:hypothetical protein
MRKTFGSLLVVLLCAGFSGTAQQGVQVTLDSLQAAIGSPLKLRLDVGPVAAGTAIQWPQIPDSFGALVRTGTEQADTVTVNGEVRYLRTYPFVGLDSGIFNVPALSFAISGRPVQSAPLSIYLYPVEVDTTQPIDPIRDIIAAPQPFNWRPWAIGLLIAAMVAILAWLLFRKKKSRPAPAVIAPPHGFAQLLRELQAEGLPQRGEYRMFYTRLTDILRDALAIKGGFKTREITSAQLLRRSGKILEPMPLEQLRAILAESDAVKFAKLHPTLEQQDTILHTALAFLQNARIR